eukprot:scaffold47753_cov58-Attheya_sp.AAC.3
MALHPPFQSLLAPAETIRGEIEVILYIDMSPDATTTLHSFKLFLLLNHMWLNKQQAQNRIRTSRK